MSSIAPNNVDSNASGKGAMQRSPKGMGRGQQRESSAEMTQDTTATLRGLRSNSKLKVLVRSHAMREETSPPRDPSYTNLTSLGNCSNNACNSSSSNSSNYHQQQQQQQQHHHQPTTPTSTDVTGQCLNPSSCLSPTNVIRCSPTMGLLNTPPYQDTSTSNSPSHTPTTIVVQCSQEFNKMFISEGNNISTVRTQDISTKYVNSSGNGYSSGDTPPSKVKCDEKTSKCAVTKNYNNSDLIIKNTNINSSSPNQTSSSENQKIKSDSQRNTTLVVVDNTQFVCSNCLSPNCTKCSKHSERNINNNISSNINNNMVSGAMSNSSNTLTVTRSNKHKLRQQSSSIGSFEGSTSSSPSLSRDNSMEQYTDTTGVDLVQFIAETLNKNAKDRVLMLKIEQELVTLAKDKVKTHYKFPPMSSYQRMLVHRCAAFFGMDHNIETSGKCVVVNKTKNTRIPEMRFEDHVREDILFPEEPRRSILKRDSNSFEDCNYKSPDHHMGMENRRSKSFEEREEEYEKVRRRIFKDGTVQECESQEDFVWSEAPWPENEISKIKLLPPEYNSKQNKLLKVQSVDHKNETLRPCVAKSHSFGGYGGTVSVLTRGDSVTSTHSAGPRLLTKQDSSTSTISWRLSPSSSGYKSQSQRSDSVTPSPTTTPLQLSDTSGKSSMEGTDPLNTSMDNSEASEIKPVDLKSPQNSNQLLWAVTDMQSVPKGSVLINPQTGQPFTNEDGSIYHFDPSDPPPGYTINSKPPPSPKVASPQKSPTKDRSQSPKKPKSKVSPLKNKSCLINSSTSPILPGTPTTQPQQNIATTYVQNSHIENTANIPMPSYPIYPNNYLPPNDSVIPMYQSPINMMYGSYGIAPQYDNRTEPPIAEIPSYFMNMPVPESPCGAQSVGYQPPGTFWNQQSVPYYQTPLNQPQRYPVAIPMPNQSQGAYMTATYPPNYVPIQQNAAPLPPNPDLVSVYTNSPLPMVYTAQQTNPNPMYIQNPGHIMYTQNPMYPHGSAYPNLPYPANAVTPNNTQVNNAYPPANFGPNTTNQPYHQSSPHMQQTMPPYDMKMSKNISKSKNNQKTPMQPQQHSNSSGGSNSPSSTVITGYFPNPTGPINYRQCTPPETPPTQNIGYNYSQNCQPIMFKPMTGVRASPPVNVRNSRSPTPASDYSQCNSAERNQRICVAPNVYHGMHCVLSDVRQIPGRGQPQVYRQPQRPQNFNQSLDNTASGRSPKVRRNRTKVPALPPSGRQSNQSISTHAQRF